MKQLSLLEEQKQPWEVFLPEEELLHDEPVPTYLWDIPYTIPQLAYLTHSHYRYYGKFPSVVAGQILEKYQPRDTSEYVLDNFCGSGTTLVEAKLRGINSFGVDISWLAVLASNVKVRKVDLNKVQKLASDLIENAHKVDVSEWQPDDFVEKWFTYENLESLKKLQRVLVDLPASYEKDFILVAYIGIVRRVSKAFDGEVRPHINKDKKIRNVYDAFSKKITDMVRNHSDFQEYTQSETQAECFLADNITLPKRFQDRNCYLVISHPPYLNSFNYSPVFSLEFYWGRPFEQNYVPDNYCQLHKKELRAHPANAQIVSEYYDHLLECYKASCDIQKEGGYLAVVVGDCTRNKKVIPVINTLIDRIVAKTDYTLHELFYRTTHYGLGKYAYNHRADYHGDTSVKKDGIMVFRKV